jgi:hypothetical protein
MRLTYHPVRLFRLSCGCLREYPMMPAGTEHDVLCITCRRSAVTLLAYPEKCCGVTSWAVFRGRRLRVSCTLGIGACVTGLHLDTCAAPPAAIVFVAGMPALLRSREGRTGRA